MKPLYTDVLLTAAAQVRAGWCRGNYSEDAKGMGVVWSDPTAVRFCAVGAILRSTDDPNLVCLAKARLKSFLHGQSVTGWNDAQTDSEAVARALEEAAK